MFVSHDLQLVEEICDRACLLHAGPIVERGKPAEIVAAYRDLLK